MEKRLENRLQSVYTKMKRNKDKSLINNDIKTLLEEFKQPNKEEQPIKFNNHDNQKVIFYYLKHKL